RSGHAWRTGGRSLHLPVGKAASPVRARWRRPFLPRADFDGHRLAWRRDRGADAGRQEGESESAGRRADRSPVPLAGQGHAGAQFPRYGRSLYPDHRRDPGEPDAQAEGSAERVRGSLFTWQQPAKHGLLRQGEGVLGRVSELELSSKLVMSRTIDQAAFVRRLIFFWS